MRTELNDLDWLHSPLDAPCPYCGEKNLPLYLIDYDIEPELSEAVRDANFIWDTCCEALQNLIISVSEDDGWDFLLNNTKCGQLLAQESGAGRQFYFESSADQEQPFKIDYGLGIELLGGDSTDHAWASGEVRQKVAKQFITDHHRHNKAPPGWLWGHAVFNGPELIAIIWVGRPVAREIDHHAVCEVNRLCIDHSLNPKLTWKAASLGYRAAAEEAARRGYSKIITYTLAQQESGRSLRYARWRRDGKPSRGGSWSRPSRARSDHSPIVPKQRWAKQLDSLDQRQGGLKDA